MKDISEGDTLYIRQGDIDVPALQIKNLSTVSCVCVPLLTDAFKVSDDVYAYVEPQQVLTRFRSPKFLKPILLKKILQTRSN